MSFSTEIVSKALESNKKLSVEDLGFITTVLRDNCKSDSMYRYYDSVLRFLNDVKTTK